MNKRLLFIFLFLGFCAAAVSGQEDYRLKLTEQDVGQTFTVQTGTVIEVRLFFGDLYVAYDPALLRFLEYTPPNVPMAVTAESGIVEPEPPATGGGSDGEPGSFPVQAPPSQPGVVVTAEVSPGMPVAPGGVGAAQVAVIGPAITNLEANPEDVVSTWRFLAVSEGETTLEFRSFYPPCLSDQPCPMMPESSVSYNLVIEGEPIIAEQVDGEGDTLLLTPTLEEQTITLQSGQIIALDTDLVAPPFRLIYHPLRLQYLDSEGVRFLVNNAGIYTRLGIQDADGNLFAFAITILPLCDSCGVRGG